MEAKANQTPAHEEFEPFCKWQRKEDRDILEIHLQDFKKEQLKVQISNHGMLKVSGERALDGSRKSKFYKEFQLSSKYDAPAIHAKFINGWLYITMPKRKNLSPEKDEKMQVQPPEIDQTPKQEPHQSKTSPEQETKEQTQEKTPLVCEFQGRKSLFSGRRLAKVAVTLAATAAVAAALTAYVVYMYKSTVDEVDDCVLI